MRKTGATRSGGYSDELRRSALEKQQLESDKRAQERRDKTKASRPEKPITPPTSDSQGPTEDEATFEEQNDSFATAGDEDESNLGDFDEEEGAHAPHNIMVEYDMEDGTDAPEIHNRMATVKVKVVENSSSFTPSESFQSRRVSKTSASFQNLGEF